MFYHPRCEPMNIIHSHPVAELGYHFIEAKHLPKGKDEYYLRFAQSGNKVKYRELTDKEIDTLITNRNSSDNWKKVLVTKGFNPALVRNCKFFGLVRIGKLQPYYREYHNLRMAVGLYNSTIISSDIGDNVCIENVHYLSHYIIGHDVMLANINELACTDKAKFGNGILKAGEVEKQRVKIEVCNENGGRSIIPFDGMLAGDAYMWSKYRDDRELLEKFREFTQNQFDAQRGYYGTIGDRTIIKNCSIIKDVKIGSDAYIKGANKLKNLTVNSDPDRQSQIGEGCELVNGIIGYGCRIFYGVKAVRFITASHSQLKYGARLINSYLGNNSTISCCEVLNTLIFPAHEQHHNNSFLCASLVMGQSNIAAGATIGSNHNSRSADGEILAERGFWPGLCVSLKHNSKFAAFSILSKGDYPHELNIPIPFSLISHDVPNNRLVIMPAYWFMYNMYALARNAWKYQDRDKRTLRTQHIEYDYLAPDTINAMFDAIKLFRALDKNEKGEAIITGWENSKRPILLTKIVQAEEVFTKMIKFYACREFLSHIQAHAFIDFDAFKKTLASRVSRSEWMNVGGQLIRKDRIASLKKNIKSGKVRNWEEVHQFYRREGSEYQQEKLLHAYTSLQEILNITGKQFTRDVWSDLLKDMQSTAAWMVKGIYDSREKDYSNEFRKMMYDNQEEMDQVIGKLEDNSFIQEQMAAMDKLAKEIRSLKRKWRL